ncbi:MAG TPA: alpha-1,4-glucan--maltose-1-phosphate maltosyltransferase [Acidimicrobiales bacterium]|nr:alpha-1,4-glucan--maltose-1-phosphate maltosyltransferase [Acidimicrobiales bacterium]
MTGRVVIDDVRPAAPHAGFMAKAVQGEAIPVSATIFTDGRDTLAARALIEAGGGGEVLAWAPLALGINDSWGGTVVVPDGLGPRQVVIEAWVDRHASWVGRVEAKLGADQDVSVEIAEGVAMLAGADIAEPPIATALAALRDDRLPPAARLVRALSAGVAAGLAGPEGAPRLTRSAPAPLWVDRELALCGAWYELFPRSFGGFRGTAARVPAIAAMGFDVLYLPPVHPIGTTERKGRDNSLTAGPHDPGSPWAIGSPEGGHTAIHAELGTFEDFDHLLAVAAAHGVEVALDYALQCSPDHPWVHDHPEWFHHRPDGSIAYAENPPKKYQDIYPINFWPDRDSDRKALWAACKDILDFWIAKGIYIFRVDNPHTKPVAFWEWLIPAIQADHPDVIFLAEAFTRPKVMAKLAEVGFTQSYTYFTWRTVQHGEDGIWAFIEELAHGPAADFMRPNFWPNTPDILSGPLRHGPPAAFASRFILAALLSPSYGIYSGYEFYENLPASSTDEEYLNSEKYEIKHRDFAQTQTLAPLITAVNAIRRRHPAFSRLRTIKMHPSDNPAIVAFSKTSDDGADVVLVVVTLDSAQVQESTLHLDTAVLGVPGDRPFYVIDELSGELYMWSAHPFVRLDPASRVVHILNLRAGI